ncbi:MAG: hypothetical protein SFT90_08495 [Rickettsiales bacterium]|nr:hypothetical protein [Rickettsiales bacterium]
MTGDPKTIRILTQVEENERYLSVTPTNFNLLKVKNPLVAATELVSLLEGFRNTKYKDGPFFAIGYGFNLGAPDAKKIYDKIQKNFPNEPSFEKISNVDDKSIISENFAKALLKETIEVKKKQLDNLISFYDPDKRSKKQISFAKSSIPDEVYIGLIAEFYHNSSRITIRNGENLTFSDEFLDFIKNINDPKQRQNFAEGYAKHLSDREDGYKLTNRALSIGMFYSGNDKYKFSDETTIAFIERALIDDQNKNNHIIITHASKSIADRYNQIFIEWGFRSNYNFKTMTIEKGDGKYKFSSVNFKEILESLDNTSSNLPNSYCYGKLMQKENERLI